MSDWYQYIFKNILIMNILDIVQKVKVLLDDPISIIDKEALYGGAKSYSSQTDQTLNRLDFKIIHQKL